MKGTIAILGCLIAAYAAPLFANEVPLILDETIQLPVATGIWDVMPTYLDGYHWIAAIETADSGTKIYFGNTMLQGLDSTEMIRGIPLALAGYLNVEEQVSMALSTYRYYDLEAPSDSIIAVDTSWTRFETLPDRAANASTLTYPGWVSEERHSFSTTRRAAVERQLRDFEPIPAPPETSDSLAALYRYKSWTHDFDDTPGDGSSWKEELGRPITNALAFTEDWLPITVAGSHSCFAMSNDRLACAAFGHTANWFYADLNESFRFNLFSTYWNGFQVDTQSALGHSEEYTSKRSPGSKLAVTYDPISAGFRALFHWRIGVWSPEAHAYTVSPLGNITEISGMLQGYSQFLTAKVLPDSAYEQAIGLGYETNLHVLHMGTGELWGTIPITSGYEQAKIVARFDDDNRRLVVRYGSELRIYRFGDPIYTDADDAPPELPSELTLSAYPNPFNPTTMIAFDLPKAARASLVVYDLNGRQVQSLFDEQISAGHHEIGFDGAALPSGIYFARLSAGELVKTQKMVLLK